MGGSFFLSALIMNNKYSFLYIVKKNIFGEEEERENNMNSNVTNLKERIWE